VIDLHVHTARCRHAEGSVSDYVAAAERAGVSVLAFTDHLPLPDGYDAGYAMPPAELPDYVAEVREAAATASAEVLCGVEADWLPSRAGEVAALLGSQRFDVVLGSVHFVDDWAFDDPALTDRYAEWSIDELWDRYFAEVAAAAASGLFDVMAHVDLVKKFGMLPESDPAPLYERTARALAGARVAVEVSTAGLRKRCGEIYPSAALLAELRRCSVPVTVGSDAHRPHEVGYAWEAAVALLREAGYRSALVFRDRVPEEVPLP
jgi:histidinol-phosphatase (PHP family)